MKKRIKPNGRVAVVTGADRGIGFEVCRELAELGYMVVLTSPDGRKGRAAHRNLLREGIMTAYHTLDVTDLRQILALRRFILEKFGRIDVLINNAGVMLDIGHSRIEGRLVGKLSKKTVKKDYGEGPQILDVDIALVRAALEVNTLGPLRMCQAFVPLMIKAGYGRVVNVSSRLGQLKEMTDDDTVPSYRLSKTALNAVTRMVADDASKTNVLVNSVCPGWTRTELGGPGAPQSVKEAARTIIWLATQPDGGPTGGFFAEKKPIDW